MRFVISTANSSAAVAWNDCDEVGLSRFARFLRAETLEHWMTDEDCPEAGLVVELRFEREDAEH